MSNIETKLVTKETKNIKGLRSSCGFNAEEDFQRRLIVVSKELWAQPTFLRTKLIPPTTIFFCQAICLRLKAIECNCAEV
jgi:hypothetical protein